MKQILQLWFGLALLIGLVAGCAMQSDSVLNNPGTATCYVCRYNNDLACVNLKLKDSTPRAEYQGITCYFCSEDCREAFLKRPQKYLRR